MEAAWTESVKMACNLELPVKLVLVKSKSYQKRPRVQNEKDAKLNIMFTFVSAGGAWKSGRQRKFNVYLGE